MSHQATENLRTWARLALELAPAERLETSEWVSLDCRCQLHITLLVVGRGASRSHYRIDRASERIQTGDVLALARVVDFVSCYPIATARSLPTDDDANHHSDGLPRVG